MRVSTGMLNTTAVNDLARVWSRLQGLQSQIATGKRVSKPSDDPIAADRVLRVRSQQRATEQYTRNLNEAREFATASDAAITRLVEVADRIQEIVVQVADSSYGPEARAGLAAELDGLLEELVGLANTEYAGKRLFGGYQTREEPFSATYDAEGNIVGAGVVERGTEGRLQRLVGDNVLLTINLTPTDLFGEDLEFFDDIVALRDAALSGESEKAGNLVTPLAEDLDRLNLGQALVGGLISRIDGIDEWLGHLGVELEATRSEYEDLDMAKAAMEYQKEQAILQAALNTTTNLMSMSLVNYMK
jgi:flagellar hook-associated protein 3 FlgL